MVGYVKYTSNYPTDTGGGSYGNIHESGDDMFDELKKKWKAFNNESNFFVPYDNDDVEDLETDDGIHYYSKDDMSENSVLNEDIEGEHGQSYFNADDVRYHMMNELPSDVAVPFIIEKIQKYIEFNARHYKYNQLIFIEHGDFIKNESESIDGDTDIQRAVIDKLRQLGYVAEHRTIQTSEDLKYIYENIPSRNIVQLDVGKSYLYLKW